MPRFPGRSVVEPLMPIKLLPYTPGVSSTMVRAQLLQSEVKQSSIAGSTDGVTQQAIKKNL